MLCTSVLDALPLTLCMSFIQCVPNIHDMDKIRRDYFGRENGDASLNLAFHGME